MSEELLTRMEGSVLWITLNRPQKHNALTFRMYDRIIELCGSVPEDGSVRAIVFTGAGTKAFAAGTDISEFRSFATPQDGIAYEETGSRVFTAIEECPVPTIAAIAGACTGGGAGIASCCDMRVATRDMRFGFPISRTLGNLLSAATLGRLAGLMGQARVIDLIYTARLMPADEALRVGLVHELVDDHPALMARAKALSEQIAGHAPLTLRATKELLRRMRSAGPAIDDHDWVGRVYTSADFKEGMEAFLAKRPPRWQGR